MSTGHALPDTALRADRVELLEIQRGHARAAPRGIDDEALGLEHSECVADRNEADIELVGEPAQRAAGGSWDNTVRLWDVETGKLQSTLARHDGRVSSLAFSPDGKLLASGGWDKKIILTRAPAGGTQQILASHEDWVQAVADATGLPIDCVAVPEGGALGSAWLARIAAGFEEPTAMTEGRRWARTGRRVEPDPAWVEPVNERYERFLELAT